MGELKRQMGANNEHHVRAMAGETAEKISELCNMIENYETTAASYYGILQRLTDLACRSNEIADIARFFEIDLTQQVFIDLYHAGQRAYQAIKDGDEINPFDVDGGIV